MLRRPASLRLFGAGHLARNPDRSACKLSCGFTLRGAAASWLALYSGAAPPPFSVALPLHACTSATCFLGPSVCLYGELVINGSPYRALLAVQGYMDRFTYLLWW